ncbi:hypothetical protein GOB57_24520 [Sinorhizobium meliloti]|nr:hypothetical protein [Sinorhizobium meliloti]
MGSTRWHMDEEDVAAHLAFLSRIGISDRDVRMVETMMRGSMGDDHVAIFERLLPLLPVDLAIRMLEGERRMMEVRPHMWDATTRPWLVQRSRIADLGATIMDMRVASGDPEAVRAAVAMREFAHFIDEFERKLAADPE